jgi:LAO/AO transport system kinase
VTHKNRTFALQKHLILRHKLPLPSELAADIRSDNRVALARAITLVESTLPEHQRVAEATLDLLLAESPRTDSYRVGISGAPGVGKSTLIEALGLHLLSMGKRVAVLAIDPSSAVSGGSILGDKTRMERLSMAEQAFVRPSPAGDSLGGVTRKTREAILLVEAAGYDIVLIETVGVGQSEIAAQRMTDVFVLLLQPGAGDELQGIKRGIVEMADLVVVNKSDGEQAKLANQAKAHYLNALHLFPPKSSGWTPQVIGCSALEAKGIDQLWDSLEAFEKHVRGNHFFTENRAQQARYWLDDALQNGLKAMFEAHPGAAALRAELERLVQQGKRSPFAAAAEILQVFAAGR